MQNNIAEEVVATNTSENADKTTEKEAKKYKRKTIQVSVYLQPNEIEYLDKMCHTHFLTRPTYLRKLLVEDIHKNTNERI
ncbi:MULTISPECIES: P-loop NTPase fold protein [unclassified Campylobacter]|uniref:P-loop NTPase fold protein n=1 Tax=unclassified Campylobacter TaxID=2593542 RepID=UPI0022E9CF40|nr:MULTISPECIES: P-loop NTPase fold protein [unclassified Campylobacter]MDA3055011.1 P-loop NTPase fold protein [Campylobacter sp. VBCF_07 NA4]MDA3060513.1 P-loop NTPase fold protein [Campylobacter sp. VBCF_02 NA5]MDA3070221.1 P-loop NTPase fold protein [Campylobacter sp. VBCF_08 NA3]WBR54654.1 P-loop NTPase fold protein [Campylobacter sp. VBCF_01 NA2]